VFLKKNLFYNKTKKNNDHYFLYFLSKQNFTKTSKASTSELIKILEKKIINIMDKIDYTNINSEETFYLESPLCIICHNIFCNFSSLIIHMNITHDNLKFKFSVIFNK